VRYRLGGKSKSSHGGILSETPTDAEDEEQLG
jgi:hypothetical protein